MGAVDVKPIREVMKAIEPVIAKAGAHCRVEGGTGGHARLYIGLNGQERFTPLSTSPRTTAQAIKYKLSDVKRILRELAA